MHLLWLLLIREERCVQCIFDITLLTCICIFFFFSQVTTETETTTGIEQSSRLLCNHKRKIPKSEDSPLISSTRDDLGNHSTCTSTACITSMSFPHSIQMSSIFAVEEDDSKCCRYYVCQFFYGISFFERQENAVWFDIGRQ